MTTPVTINNAIAAALVGAAVIITGCSDTATREDVADARQELRDEQQDLAEERLEAQHEIADARHQVREHTVGKPVLTEEAVEAREELADTRQDALEDIAEQQTEVQEAAQDLNTEQARLQATQARNAYVKDVETHLAGMQKDIDQMEAQAESAEATEKDAITLRIESLRAQHDRTAEALEDLKDADPETWQNYKQQVSTAMQGETVR